ncbi:Uncharacterized protein FWK35_00003570 [Aphis craccivora]|uniref:Uncharacterized protein n=1 Tax=Aphis craccivora TaxID=307492 RepID=A0A6G0Z9S7_APHCR|nr:Uncharacterized protein FWK35_00003570 [Aphis craccivora]
MSITSQNNDSISNFGGGFRRKSEYIWCIIEGKSKHFLTVLKKKTRKKKVGKSVKFESNDSVILRNLTKTRKFTRAIYRQLPLKHKPPFSSTTENYILG